MTKKTINVRLPKDLKLLKESLGVGLLYMANGLIEDIEDHLSFCSNDLEQTSINLSMDAANYLEIIKNRESMTQQQIVITVLNWVALQPLHVKETKI